MKKIKSSLELLKLKLEVEKNKLVDLQDKKSIQKKELVILKLEIRIIEEKLFKLNKAWLEESDSEVKGNYENKIAKLNIELNKLKFPDIFINPAIIESDEDKTLGCIKVKKNKITYTEYKRLVEQRIGGLLWNKLRILKNKKNDKYEIDKKDYILIVVKNIYSSLSIQEKKYPISIEEILEEIFESNEYRAWDNQIHYRFEENKDKSDNTIDIHGDNILLADLYDEDAYEYVNEVTFDDIIDALCNF